MKRKARNKRAEPGVEQTEARLTKPRAALLDAATLSGAVAGAALGAIAGPPGIVAGGIVGTAVGVLTGVGLDKAQHARDRREKTLDDEIGVTKGDLGAASPDAPPPTRGAYSSSSAGVSRPSGTPSEGPISEGDAET